MLLLLLVIVVVLYQLHIHHKSKNKTKNNSLFIQQVKVWTNIHGYLKIFGLINDNNQECI